MFQSPAHAYNVQDGVRRAFDTPASRVRITIRMTASTGLMVRERLDLRAKIRGATPTGRVHLANFATWVWNLNRYAALVSQGETSNNIRFFDSPRSPAQASESMILSFT
jgi:hypothetical protein